MTDSNDCVDSDEKLNEIEEQPAGTTDSLLQPSDPNDFADQLLTFAQGEGNQPTGIFHDTNLEFLSLPTIYCGKTRCDDKDRMVPTHSDICKWELRSKDRRVAQSIPTIFYKLKNRRLRIYKIRQLFRYENARKKGKRTQQKISNLRILLKTL